MSQPRVQANRLRPARSPVEYSLHRAAVEWDLDAALVINSAEDIRSRKHWSQLGFSPFEHQIRNLLTFCRRAPVSLIADDVGLGKTISAGLILSELFVRHKASRALVLCPKILLAQWQEELRSKFGIDAVHAVGQPLEGCLNSTHPVVITTYDSARPRFAVIKAARFDVLILDEAHKLRNLHPGKPPRFAAVVHGALAERLFRYVVMLTATPVKNRIWDLYSLIDCLATAKGHRNPLGSPSDFKSRFLAGSDASLELRAGRTLEFRQVLSQYMVRTRRTDAHLQFPERRVRTDREPPTSGEVGLMGLVGKMISGLPGFLQTSVAQALMSSPEALIAQLKNMAGCTELAAVAERHREAIPLTSKLKRLLQLVAELKAQNPEDWRVVVFTIRKETQTAIGAALAAAGYNAGYIKGGSAQNTETIRRFWQEPPEIHVLVSTDTGAEGVNLQVANVIVNYDLPWDPMIIEQRIGRIQRLGSRHAHVEVLNLVVGGSVEERVVARLMSKLQLIAHAVGDVEAILESAELDGEGHKSFEGMIRQMVVESLRGQNVDEALRLAVQSVERGRAIYEQEHEAVEAQLGQLDALHRTGPRMPKLTRVTPSVPVRSFVLEAMRADNGDPVELRPGVWKATPAGRAPVYFSFERDAGPAAETPVFFGPNLRLFTEGSADFTRLVGEWTRRAEHQITTDRLGDVQVQALVQAWVEQIPGAAVMRVDTTKRQGSFAGAFVVKAAAAVAHDRYEKVIEVPTPGRVPLPPAVSTEPTDPTSGEVDPAEWWPDIKRAVMTAANSDFDLQQFSRFYTERLREEIEAAGDAAHRQRIQETFEPFLAVEVLGMHGRYVERREVRVELSIDGHAGYSAALELQAEDPQTQGPVFAYCEESQRRAPEPFISVCAISGRKALRHLFFQSAESGRTALSKFAVPCPDTGELLLPDELTVSGVSGRPVRRSLSVASAVSGIIARRDEIGSCEFTGVPALPTELRSSDVSGRKYRTDEEALSSVSGLAGHRSEFERCCRSGDYLLESEGKRSAVTGHLLRPDLARTSTKPPYRVGAVDEIVQCAVSGADLLSDEVVTSAVSGLVVDRDLTWESAASGARALPAEMVVCEDTAATLLPSEVARCELTAKLVDKRLLGQSEVSGVQALASLLVRCQLTGSLALPAETGVCEVTGARALLSQFGTCSVTGKRAVLSEFVVDSITGQPILRRVAVRSDVSGRWGLKTRASTCAWSGATILPDEVGTCTATGVRVAKSLLDEQSLLVPLRALLERREAGIEEPQLGRWLTDRFGSVLGKPVRVETRSATNDGLVAVSAEVRERLGLKVRYWGFLMERPTGTVVGHAVCGRRSHGRWYPERSVRLT